LPGFDRAIQYAPTFAIAHGGGYWMPAFAGMT